LDLAWSAASSASTGSVSAVLSKQTNPLASEHASMLTCGKGQLQPARIAASAPMKSALMHSPFEAEFRSQFLLHHNILRWPSISCAKKLNAH
jgi:hypothetical protein